LFGTRVLLTSYFSQGDLASQIKAAKRNLFSEAKILHWFVQLTLGLHYMHCNKVLHRDLKTQNVFMLGNGRLVLGDLGISKVLDGTVDFAQTCIGTPYCKYVVYVVSCAILCVVLVSTECNALLTIVHSTAIDMSPEIFKNKPYNYKSDVWALGCVLYEMTTLNHAFDANSLNGLATKIVKGKYPPISPKYSKHLSDLIAQMLQLSPQQRPDLDQILRKPFIKKHIVNFFSDIASRPSNSIGEGTMVIRAAVGGGGQLGALNNDSNMISLRQQLHALGMTDAVAEALAPKSTPQDDHEAIKLAKEQASALQREKEHKKNVEAALEKLRLERENRAKQLHAAPQGAGRPSGYPAPQVRQVGGANANAGRNARVAPMPTPAPAVGPPSARNPSIGSNLSSIDAARREAVRRQQAAQGDDGSSHRDGDNAARRADAARRRSFGEDADRDAHRGNERDRRAALEEQRRQEEASKHRAEEKRRDDARAEAKAREDARAREEQRVRDESRSKEEVQARLRVEQLKVEQVRAQAEAAAKAKREAAREKERVRQREEIEQLKRDKLMLDQRAADKDRVREAQREQERARLEGKRREQVENSRREQLEVMQEKLGNMNDQISRMEKVPRPRPGALPDRAEEKEEVSARERVLQRRQEKQAKDEADRLEQIRLAEVENRRLRQEANQHARQQFHSDADYQRYEFDTSDRGGGGRSRMDSNELHDRLSDATKGRGDRYAAALTCFLWVVPPNLNRLL
jgi:NIMA (never in mitosis gene a)-related kinase